MALTQLRQGGLADALLGQVDVLVGCDRRVGASGADLARHPAFLQYRALLEAWRSNLAQPSSAAVRVDAQLLSAQWAVVEQVAGV